MKKEGRGVKVLVIGATGFLGGGAARALRAGGHEVVANARGDVAAKRLRDLGYEVVRGDVAQPETLIEAARAADATIYAVQLTTPDAAAVDGAALRALAGALEGTSKAFVYTSGIWFYGPVSGPPADEDTPPNPPPYLAARPQLEAAVLESANRGVRAIVLRPGDVFGEGKGLPSMFVASARDAGAARTIGDGSNRWPVIHVDDLGRLYVAAVERAQPGDVYNVNDETAYAQLEIAQAASRGAGKGGATAVWPVADAVAAMGPWASALAMDQVVTSARARARLGWAPREATIVDDLERGSYASGGAA